MAVDEVVVRASLRDELSKPLGSARKEVERFDKAVDRTGKSTVTASRGFGDLSRQIRVMDGGLRTASASLGHLAAQATKTATISLGTMGVAAAGFGLKAEAGFEQSRIAFGTLVESVEGGNQLFKQLQDFNLKTPFELGEISSATQTLLQFGFTGENVMETLKSISDISATTAAPGENLNRIALALGQISSAGVLRGQDLNQLVQAGFPAYQLLTQVTGQTTQELRKQMETGLTLPAEEFIAALNEGGGVLAKFASGAEMQAGTLSGVFSNLKDTTQVQLAEAFQPLAEGLKEGLPQFTKTLGAFIDEVAPPLAEIGLTLVDLVGSLLPTIAPPITALFTGLGRLLETMTPGFAALEPVMFDLGLAIGDLVTALVPVMPDLVDAFVAVVGVLPDVVRLLGAFVPLISPLANLVEDLASLDGVMAGLLVTLLGYRALSAVATSVTAMATALNLLTGAQIGAAAAGAGGAAGGAASKASRFGKLAKIAAGGSALAGAAAIPLLATVGGIGADVRNYGGTSPVLSATAPDGRQWIKNPRTGAVLPSAGRPPVAGQGVTIGKIEVNNPRQEIDVSRAVARAMDDQYRSYLRRADDPTRPITENSHPGTASSPSTSAQALYGSPRSHDRR